MAGISSKALYGAAENKKKYNGIEQTNEFDLNMYDAFYRNLDPQIGRFWQIDPEAESLTSYSPFESMGNNPISNEDPLGNFRSRFGAWLHKVFNGGGEVGQNNLGEWFVRKTETSYSQEEGPTVTAKVTYGKGRDRYSTAREELVRDMYIATDIFMNGERSMYKMYDSPQDAGKGALSIGTGLVLINPFLKAGTSAVNAGKVVNEAAPAVQTTENTVTSLVRTGVEYTSHAAKQRMIERGITPAMVEKAIEKGVKYYDPKNGVFNYILKNGFASGKDLLVGTNTVTGKVTTVIRGTNLTAARFIPQ
jgi:RHS repeat-associated protein